MHHERLEKIPTSHILPWQSEDGLGLVGTASAGSVLPSLSGSIFRSMPPFVKLQSEALHVGAFYLRLVGRPMEVYQYLEPLYNDYRRIRRRTEAGHFELTHVDQLVDEMLRNEYLFDIALPRVPNRSDSHNPPILRPADNATKLTLSAELNTMFTSASPSLL